MTVSIADVGHVRDHPATYFAATAKPVQPRPALEGVKQVDVCVVGGGYTGLSAARHCAERGYSVVVLEGRRIGWGASGRNGGQVIPGWNRSAQALVRRFGPDHARQIFAMAVEAVDLLWQIIKQHHIICYPQRGHLMAAATPRDAALLEAEQRCRENVMGYYGSRFADQKAVAHLTGSEAFYGGLLDAQGGHVHPLNLALGLARIAELAGARIHENTRVQRLRHGGLGVIAECNRGRVMAKHLVLACGALAGSLLPSLQRRTVSLPAFAAATAPLPQAVAETLVKDGLAVCDTRLSPNYFRMSSDRRLLFGGGERISLEPVEDVGAIVRPRIEAIFPQLTGISLDYAWSGLVTLTSSRMPAVGQEGHIFYAHGYSGQGVALAHLMGKVIAEAIAGQEARFNLLSSLPNISVPGGRWLRLPVFAAKGAFSLVREAL